MKDIINKIEEEKNVFSEIFSDDFSELEEEIKAVLTQEEVNIKGEPKIIEDLLIRAIIINCQRVSDNPLIQTMSLYDIFAMADDALKNVQRAKNIL